MKDSLVKVDNRQAADGGLTLTQHHPESDIDVEKVNKHFLEGEDHLKAVDSP